MRGTAGEAPPRGARVRTRKLAAVPRSSCFLEVRRKWGVPAKGDAERWEAWLGWVAKYADLLKAQLATGAGPDPEPFNENAYYY